jgi:prolyl-tRNA synthetase
VVIPVSYQDEMQRTVAESLYEQLEKLGVETVLDDRLDRAGVKFKDADLIGYPYRITVGAKALKEGQVEVRNRLNNEDVRVKIEAAAEYVANQLKQQLAVLD